MPLRSMRIDRDVRPLLTERLMLRRSLPEDAEAIAVYRFDPDVLRHQGWERTDAEGIAREIGEMAARAPGGTRRVGAVHGLRAGGRLVDDVGLSRVEDEPEVIKIGYTIAPAFPGRGYATEAVGGFGIPQDLDRSFARLVEILDAALRSWNPTT